jgi:hypothetical protein
LRHTGIRFMGDMPWGTHVCLFYETPQDLLDTAVCYFEAGLKSNEFCVWAVSDPISLPQAEKALRRAVPGSDRHRARNAADLAIRCSENNPAAPHDRQTRFLTGVNACRPARAKHDRASTNQPAAGACHGQHQF